MVTSVHKKAGRNLFILAALCVVLISASKTFAVVRMPKVFGSHMVLQQDKPIPVWGWAEPNEKIMIAIGSNEAATIADNEGKWTVKLAEIKAGGPYTMTITGTNKIELTDILVGEVWLASGQSNMEMGIQQINNARQEIAEANYPQIRLFLVARKNSGVPLTDVDAEWKVCTPQTIVEGGGMSGFSAVQYFFGRELYKKLNVPIGLIDSSWGGTRIEPWTPLCGYQAVPTMQYMAQFIEKSNTDYKGWAAASLNNFKTWVKKSELDLEKGLIPSDPPRMPDHPLTNMYRPTPLYNAMIHPLAPFALRGFIWYQGEGNQDDGMVYYDEMKALIYGWREVWGDNNLPFYYVQIAPLYSWYWPERTPKFWEAQTASMAIPNTGMAVTIDIGDLNDVHPRNKQDVGKRLALWAFAKTYGFKDIVCSGPIYKSIAVEKDKIRINFDYTGGGLASRDGKPLTWFEIAGADKVFCDANAVIDANTVVVSSEKVKAPAAVRFAWRNTAVPNFMNKEGLPAPAFRTDRWE